MSILLDKPYLINFPKTGGSVNGYISIAEKKDLPFIPKRVYWTYFTPESLERGGHAHINLEQILVAVSGVINLKIETCEGEIFKFILNSPSIGVFLPKKCWRTMRYSHNAVQMCIASIEYNESDYVRDYKEFKKTAVK
jgi:hypothetical protein